MSKLQLPQITALCADCVNSSRAIKVLEHCKSICDFGDVKFLSSIPNKYEHWVKIKPLNSLVAYSIFMLKHIHEYVNTSHMIILQRDGWILNTSSWNPDWLNLDYIGPLFVQYDRVGSGGFSLRSKRLMENVSENTPEWDGTQKHADLIQPGLSYYEDGVICLSGKFSQFKFASLEEAAMWAQGGNRNPDYYRPHPFGYHGLWANINHETGFVSPVCEHEKLDCQCNADHANYLLKMAE